MDNRIVEVLHRIRTGIGNACRNYEIENTLNSEVYRELNLYHENLRAIRSSISEETFNTLFNSISDLLSLSGQSSNESGMSYSAERLNVGRGRPSVNITRDQLVFLLNENFTVKQIAERPYCSKSVVRKRLMEENIKIRDKYTNLDDLALKEIIKSIYDDHPNCGCEMMWGYLRARGITVQRRKVRLLLKEIDQVGNAVRWSNAIVRRTYKVPTPNALWHMDAHLKIGRWGFVIHGCIDGYSRLIIYLECKISIQAEPVLELFLNAVETHGVPSRVRSDHGYENEFVAIFMNLIRGLGRGSHITGKSVHNQRIERLWVDVRKEVVQKVYKELYELEDNNELSVDNNNHRYVVQLIYLDYINELLASFKNAWNHHKIRSENKRSPRQIWIDGLLGNINTDHTAILEIFQEQGDVLQRTQEALQSVNVNLDELNLDMASEPSLFEAQNGLSQNQNEMVTNIIQNVGTCKEKVISCLEILKQ